MRLRRFLTGTVVLLAPGVWASPRASSRDRPRLWAPLGVEIAPILDGGTMVILSRAYRHDRSGPASPPARLH